MTEADMSERDPGENLPTILGEIEAIEATMRDAPRAYFRDEPLQARYRSLVAERHGGAGPGGANLLDEASDVPLVPILPLAEFAAQGGAPGDYGQYLKLARTAADWIFALPAEEQREFVCEFEALPLEVGTAALLEIAAPAPQVAPVSEAGLAHFAARPEGAVLLREWGPRAALGLARVRERLWRVIDRIPEEHAPAFAAWLDNLSTPCAIALYRKLAG
jgi:hypothetical protein